MKLSRFRNCEKVANIVAIFKRTRISRRFARTLLMAFRTCHEPGGMCLIVNEESNRLKL